jgi:lysozyme
MRTNDAGLAIVKAFEGYSSAPYCDVVGVATIGYGSTFGCDGLRITIDHAPVSKREGEKLLRCGLRTAERAVKQLVTAELTENMFSALVSLCYNIGSGNLQRSTLRMKLNRGSYEAAADEFPKWRKAGGRVLPGLVRRRAAEQELFTNGCD